MHACVYVMYVCSMYACVYVMYVCSMYACVYVMYLMYLKTNISSAALCAVFKGYIFPNKVSQILHYTAHILSQLFLYLRFVLFNNIIKQTVWI